jgi:acetylornithine/succinyldiaminopimelate/putrescine aminotransferase
MISCHNAYHGNTMGSLSIMGFEERKQIFRPLIPDVDFITFNNEADLENNDKNGRYRFRNNPRCRLYSTT